MALPRLLLRSGQLRSLRPLPPAPIDAPLPSLLTLPGDLFSMGPTVRPCCSSAATPGPPWPPPALSGVASVPQPRLHARATSPGRAGVAWCGGACHHHAAVPRRHRVVAAVTPTRLRRRFMVVGDHVVLLLFPSPLLSHSATYFTTIHDSLNHYCELIRVQMMLKFSYTELIFHIQICLFEPCGFRNWSCIGHNPLDDV